MLVSRVGLFSAAALALVLAAFSVTLGVAFAFNRYAVDQYLLADEHIAAKREAILAQRLAAKLAPLEAGFRYQEAFFLGAELCRQPGNACETQLMLLKETIQLRPYWPFGWLRYAEACSRAGDLACSLAALRQAWFYGRNERKVRQGALRIGLQHWPDLLSDDRDFIREVAQWVLRHDRNMLQQQVKEASAGDLLPLLIDAGFSAQAVSTPEESPVRH